MSWIVLVSAGTAEIYQFPAHPCFTATKNVWVSGFEVVFPAANITEDDSVVFVVFMTKDLITQLVRNIPTV